MRKSVVEAMAKQELRYDRMVEDALRSVVRRALVHVAEKGLPGNHHFYITFRTDHSEVDIPAALKERYPGEMTIVLQHQFWGLEVSDHRFSVTLSFADVPHRLVIPFAAVTAFADPSVRFGLQFDVEPVNSEKAPAEADDQTAVLENARPDLAVPKPPAEDAETAPAEPAKASDQENEKTDGGEREKKVVTLDAFRKK